LNKLQDHTFVYFNQIIIDKKCLSKFGYLTFFLLNSNFTLHACARKKRSVVCTSAYLHRHVCVYVYINIHFFFKNIQPTSTYVDNGQHLAMFVGYHMDFPTNKIKSWNLKN